MTEAAWVFTIGAAVLLAWMYAGYPLALATFVRPRPAPSDPAEWPSVTVMIMTYNEAQVIAEKLRNTLAFDYPQDRLQIMVVDSASTDETPSLVREFSGQVEFVAQPERRGKASAINFGLERARGEIVVVTDANAYAAPDVLKKITRHFQDPQVGGVTGSMRQRDHAHTAVSQSGDLYWRVESFLRVRESALHSVIGMSGEISAYRRNIFVRDGQIVDWYRVGCTDDFEQTLYIIRQGSVVRYEPAAEVFEAAPDSTQDLQKQKVRIITQTIQSVRWNLDLMFKPAAGWYGRLIFPSRKLLPLLSPWLALILLAGSIGLSMTVSWAWILVLLQCIGYGIAVLGRLPVWRNFSLPRLAAFWTTLNWHILLSWFETWRGRDYTVWEKIDSSRREFARNEKRLP